jgi:RNA polymerase sigma-70 factor (ECF subfamily)
VAITSETSKSLLERARDLGDDAAWRRLHDLYAPLIAGWLRRHELPADAAEDVAQQVLEVVVRRLPEFRHNGRVGAFRAWLRNITANCFRRWCRTHRAGVWRLPDDLEDPNSAQSRLWDREHDRHVARTLLGWVEAEFQSTTIRAFRGQVLDGRSAAEVAETEEISVNAALIAKSRVLKRLRELGRGLIDDL